MERKVISENVRALRRHLGLKQEAFAELLGGKEAGADQTNISRWESKGVEPSSVPLAKMADLAGCTVHDFLTKPWTASDEPKPANDDEIDPEFVVRLDKLDISASMGPGTVIEDYVSMEPVNFDLRFIQAITRAPIHRLKLITGVGDSMIPTLNWGDTIMIDTTDRSLSKQDGIYWINLFGAAGLKRLRMIGAGRILVKSDNPTVDDQEVDVADLRIEGRAIWFARGL